jgi:hypothetical protein
MAIPFSWRACSGARTALLVVAAFLAVQSLAADSLVVRRSQGTYHAFLVLKSLQGKPLAAGDLVQVAHGNELTARVTFHFRDGSLDDETSVYSQDGVFRLISDHHVQHGPSFPNPIDVEIDAAKRQIRSKDAKGEPVEENFDELPDLCNGMLWTVLLNLDPPDLPRSFPAFAPVQKSRLVSLAISADGEEQLSIAGVRRAVNRYRIKIVLGGVAGMVAPMVGKQPPDLRVWMTGGPAPALVKEEGEFYLGGPIWRVEIAAPVFGAGR